MMVVPFGLVKIRAWTRRLHSVIPSVLFVRVRGIFSVISTGVLMKGPWGTGGRVPRAR